MNIYDIRENKNMLAPAALGEIVNGFERALIWQDEKLDHVSDRALTYAAGEKCIHTVMIFVSFINTSKQATEQLIKHGLSQSGHDLAFQMLGHGVGFWEQDSTKLLDESLDFLLGMKAIKPFCLFYDEKENKLDWDTV